MSWLKISIDGPAGAGKSTVTKKVAQLLNLYYLDTGATYRAAALHLKRLCTTLEERDSKQVAVGNNQISNHQSPITNHLKNINISFEEKFENDQLIIRTFLNGEDVSEEIRTDEISQLASAFSAKEEVREVLVTLQKKIANEVKEKENNFNGIIAEGRDIGTVVFPDADVKIFLTASTEERARRRHKELLEKGENISYKEILESITERDHRDTTRKHSPLRQAEDAILVNTDGKTIQQVVDEIIKLISKKANVLSMNF